MNFDNLISWNPRYNATLADGQGLKAQIPGSKLYANQGENMTAADMVPETADQDSSDLPGWAQVNGGLNLATNADGANDPVPTDLPIYLQIWTRSNFYDVSGVLRDLANGRTLDQALS